MRPRALLALESQALRESGIATSQWGLGEKMASLSILSSSVNTTNYSKNVYSQDRGDNEVKSVPKD